MTCRWCVAQATHTCRVCLKPVCREHAAGRLDDDPSALWLCRVDCYEAKGLNFHSQNRRLQRLREAKRCGYVWIRKPEDDHRHHTCTKKLHAHTNRHLCGCGAIKIEK